jgi:hypothetical protein
MGHFRTHASLVADHSQEGMPKLSQDEEKLFDAVMYLSASPAPAGMQGFGFQCQWMLDATTAKMIMPLEEMPHDSGTSLSWNIRFLIDQGISHDLSTCA